MTGRRVPPAIGARPSKHGGRRGRTGGPNTKNKCAIIRPAPGVDTVVTGRRPPVLAPTGAAKGQARRNPPVAMPSTCQPGGRSTNSPSGPGWNLAQRQTGGHRQTGTSPGPETGPDPGWRNSTRRQTRIGSTWKDVVNHHPLCRATSRHTTTGPALPWKRTTRPKSTPHLWARTLARNQQNIYDTIRTPTDGGTRHVDHGPDC